MSGPLMASSGAISSSEAPASVDHVHAIALPPDEVVSATVSDAVLNHARDADFITVASVARIGTPGEAGSTLIPKHISTKRVRMLGLSSEMDQGLRTGARAARVWVQAEQLKDLAGVIRRSMSGAGKSKGTQSMHKIPSFSFHSGAVSAQPVAHAAPKHDVAEVIGKAVRVFRITCVDPGSEAESIIILSTGPGSFGASSRGSNVVSLRSAVPSTLQQESLERALIAHLCEERIGHSGGPGSDLALCPVTARAVGLTPATGAPPGFSDAEIVVEARCESETVTVWQVLKDEHGVASAAAGGAAPVPLYIKLAPAASKVGADALVTTGDVTGALQAIAGRVAMRPSGAGGERATLALIGIDGSAIEEEEAARAAEADELAVKDSAGVDVWRDTWAIAEADLAAISDGPFLDELPPAADADAAEHRPVTSHTRRKPLLPTPVAAKRATLLGLDGAPRSSPFEPRAGTGSASGAGRVRLVARPVDARADAAATVGSIVRVSTVDPASSQERHACFGIGGADAAKSASLGVSAIDAVVPSHLLAAGVSDALVSHLLEDRIVYTEIAHRWWSREALLWAELERVRAGLAAVAADAAAAGAHSEVVAFEDGCDAAVLARQALPAVSPFAQAAPEQPLSIAPALARGVGLMAPVPGSDEAPATVALPAGAESRLFVVELRCAGDSVVVRLVNTAEGAAAALKASSRVSAVGLAERSMVGALATPPPALIAKLDTAVRAAGADLRDVAVSTALLAAAERVALVRTDGGAAPTDGSEPEVGEWRLQLVPRD